MRILKLSVILFIFAAVFSYSENVRGPVVKIISSDVLLSSENTEFDVSPEDLFAIAPDFNNLPDKISIEIRSSDNIKRFRDSFSIYSYTNISPQPDENVKSYTGTYSDSTLIPDRTRFFIDIVLKEGFTDKNKLRGTEIIDFSGIKNSKPFMFTILPVMKGVPDYLLSEKFRIKISSQWPDKGKITVKVFIESDDGKSKTEVKDYSLLIDKKSSGSSNGIVLNTGIHSIYVAKDGFLDFEENISVKTNEIRNIEVVLRKNNPEITVFSPDESVFFVDGNIQNTKKITDLKPGEHTLLFKLGEYSLSRTILLEEGKKYTVNLLLDIEIKEE